MSSPLKEIVLTYQLDRGFNAKAGMFDVAEDQVIHIEPLENGEICAITMKKAGTDFEIDIRTKYPTDYYKVESAFLKTPKSGASYNFDLEVNIAKEKTPQPITHIKLEKNGHEIVSGNRLDLSFNPPMLKFGLEPRDNLVISNKADPDRICRIGIV